MMEVGKRAKKMGLTHPRELRKIDPEQPRPTPKVSHRRTMKKFGYSYARRPWSLVKASHVKFWKRVFVWFDTEKARDQALEVRQRHAQNEYERDFRKEQRGQHDAADTRL